ncbi:MAG: conjugal transfer protein TraD [Alphaproteobacteria bacterium]|jgi:hypothetical protein|nr:conjugal transfer protein TraD [Alphaproteobacteria bacterium]MBT5390339.1 conjugal transfer protein TraD [Alphaproteobacteria bacterium]
MTTTNILEKKKIRLEQLKNRLKEQESLLKKTERKSRTRKLIELGGLVSKAGLSDLNTNALYGGLLSLKEAREKIPQEVDKWEVKGGVEFGKESKKKTPVIVVFKDKPSAEIRAKIRESGLRWNAIRKDWQGHVMLKALENVLQG